MRTGNKTVRAAFSLLAAVLLTLSGTGITGAAPTQRQADDGARVYQEQWIGPRELDVRMHSPALGKNASMRLLLPPGWSKNSPRNWPVVYLLAGCCEPVHDYRSWTDFTDIEQFAKDKNVIIAMPSGGINGNYSDWWNFGRYGPPNWEKFHLDEMRQILERDYRAGTKRAIAGLSAGAYGAMEYASRRPGMFGAAASFSGILNTRAPTGQVSVLFGTLRNDQVPFALWGNPVTQSDTWRAHNPFDNADKLRGTRLFVSAGNGVSTDLDPPNQTPAANLLEPPTLANSLGFVAKLKLLGIPVTTDFYGAGTHAWPYWFRELQRAWPLLTRDF
ncbi:alpha/beta hydrolase [Sciscionella sediminilitoris]|uniref:alpha/beta hydrolase n=1 Tax=Sciscionella sediminilitoris TaxID=1445613 RepID=UPI0004DECEE0|nr:alpha/beta hydrolase family protein [Sciscionella sp. SE31]